MLFMVITNRIHHYNRSNYNTIGLITTWCPAFPQNRTFSIKINGILRSNSKAIHIWKLLSIIPFQIRRIFLHRSIETIIKILIVVMNTMVHQAMALTNSKLKHKVKRINSNNRNMSSRSNPLHPLSQEILMLLQAPRNLKIMDNTLKVL